MDDASSPLHPFSAGRSAHAVFQVLNLDDVPAAEHFDYWREMVIRGADLQRTSIEQYPVFQGVILSFATPTGELHHGDASPYISRRDARHIRRDGNDELALCLVQEGTVSQRQDKGGDALIRAGEFLLIDMTRPVDYSLTRCKLVQLDITPQMLRAHLKAIPPSKLVTEALRASKLMPLLRTQLEILPRHLMQMNDEERAAALRATEDLAIAVLEGALKTAPQAALFEAGHHSQADALFLAACRFIEREFRHPNLDVDMVAGALRCSRVTLYRAFAQHNQSVAKTIRQTRLARLRQLLAHAPHDIPISELAARCGLYDAPNLNRMFRAEYSITPSEARRHAQRDGGLEA
jgi:AraC-like DNA-binding protein